MGPVGLHQAEKFQRSLTPKGGDMGGQKFFFPPQICVIMSVIVSPTNPENLVKGCRPVFLVCPFENMGLLYEKYMCKS